jgi:transcriptional regulator with XRE-family HTH domain
VTELRINKGLSQAALADKLGYSLSYVSKLERGQMNATLRALFDVADCLEIEAEVFVKRIRRTVEVARSKSKRRV